MTEQNEPFGGQQWESEDSAEAGQPGNYGQQAGPYGQHSGQYGQQPGGGYQAPQGPPPGYGVPSAYGGQQNMPYNHTTAATSIKLNYWLSMFFSWIPALIFFLTEKDKSALMDDHLKENMNFQITRVIAGAIMVIPFIGWIVGGIASVVLFVMAILGAIRGPEEFEAGRSYRFPFAIRLLT